MPNIKSLGFERLTSPLIAFIQEGIRRTKNLLVVWNEERCCRVCCPFVMPVRKSRLSINDLLDYCHSCEYPSGSG
jgi:hypothetical protein